MSQFPTLLLLLLLPFHISTAGTTAPPNHGRKNIELKGRGMDIITVTTVGISQSTLSLNPNNTWRERSAIEHIQSINGGMDVEYYDDKDDNDSEAKVILPPSSDYLKPCDYDRCKHLEVPCNETQKAGGFHCLCPGVDGPSVPPDPPRLMQSVPEESGVSLRWCSPLSTVRGYRVLHGTSGNPLQSGPVLNSTYRFYFIEKLFPDTSYRVCVVAFNEAGKSKVDVGEDEEENWDWGKPGACRIIHTTVTKASRILLWTGVTIAVMAGMMGLAALGYWLRRRGRRKHRKIERGVEMGISNLSFRAESVEQL
ncbi:LRRN4 C-terminal-like protein [Xenopus laevis]|uniref:Fibronectin type-III domain-containing protein n=2 Tax=Xenopus laevis TaxID=8355 RepID=A0A974CXM5_XENLA|nr:LRRN4 C-terminal-like protein [Xenopus laevis]OCT81728.1 hypothetical protein XELAEV_18024236mg [Xenopus laevis]